MNPFAFVKRRPVSALLLVVVVIGGGLFAMHRMRVNIPALNTPKIYKSIDSAVVRAEQIKGQIVHRYESYFGKHEEEAPEEQDLGREKQPQTEYHRLALAFRLFERLDKDRRRTHAGSSCLVSSAPPGASSQS